MSGHWRLTRVDFVDINTVNHASVVQIGDNESSVLSDRAIALQRVIPEYFGDEIRFASYSIFFRPTMIPLDRPEGVLVIQNPPTAQIRVGSIHALNITASSLVRIGCGESHDAQSRIKFIRHFNDRGTRDIELPYSSAQ